MKARSRGVPLIMRDKLAAAPSNAEKLILFDQVRALKAAGLSYIYMSHHLDEVCERIADLMIGKKTHRLRREISQRANRVVIGRKGRTGDELRRDATMKQLILRMAGAKSVFRCTGNGGGLRPGRRGRWLCDVSGAGSACRDRCHRGPRLCPRRQFDQHPCAGQRSGPDHHRPDLRRADRPSGPVTGRHHRLCADVRRRPSGARSAWHFPRSTRRRTGSKSPASPSRPGHHRDARRGPVALQPRRQRHHQRLRQTHWCGERAREGVFMFRNGEQHLR